MATITEESIKKFNYFSTSKKGDIPNPESLKSSIKGIIYLFSNKYQNGELTESAVNDFGECLSLSRYIEGTASMADELQSYFVSSINNIKNTMGYNEEEEIKRVA